MSQIGKQGSQKPSLLINCNKDIQMLNHYRISAILSLAMALAASCSVEKEQPVTSGKAMLRLSAATKTPPAKSITGSGESAIYRWSALICLPSGRVVASLSDISGDADIELEPGRYTIYATANHGIAINGMTDVSGLLSLRIPLSSNSLEKGFVMYGSKTIDLEKTGGTETIGLERLAAKVRLERVRTDFTGKPSLASRTFIFKAAYLINVAGDASLSCPSVPSGWKNMMKWSSSDCDHLLRDDINAVITSSSPYETAHNLYPYENMTVTDCDNEPWSDRYTRLILECDIDGETYYYSVNIPGLERNRQYRITEVVIKDWGSLSPDKIIDPACEVTYSSSLDWDETYTVEEES